MVCVCNHLESHRGRRRRIRRRRIEPKKDKSWVGVMKIEKEQDENMYVQVHKPRTIRDSLIRSGQISIHPEEPDRSTCVRRDRRTNPPAYSAPLGADWLVNSSSVLVHDGGSPSHGKLSTAVPTYLFASAFFPKNISFLLLFLLFFPPTFPLHAHPRKLILNRLCGSS